jgi:hypothetical protein
MTPIDKLQQRMFDAMTPAERVQYASRMFEWARGMIERELRTEYGELSQQELTYRIALHMYGSEPAMRKLIEERLADVSA